MRIFYNKTYTQKRLVDANDKETYAVLATIEAGMYAMSPDDVILSEGDPATGAILYVDSDVDIKVLDKVVDENSEEWIVKAVKVPNNVLGYGHKRCIINLPNS